MPGIAKKRQAGVAKARQVHWPVAGSSPTAILSHRYIADPVQTILDAPVTSIQVKKVLGIGSVRPQACDRVRNVRDPLIADNPCSLNANRLGKARPVEKANESATGR